jgi:hypothetical protein
VPHGSRSPQFDAILATSAKLRSQPELLPNFIDSCKLLLAEEGREKAPGEVAGVNMALGQAYLQLAETGVIDCWRSAEEHLLVAMEACDKDDERRLYANINMELARTLGTSPLGDRHSNQMRALKYNFAAVEAWKAEGDIQLTTGVMLNIANLFGKLVDGDRYASDEAAVSYCREALHLLEGAGRDTTTALQHLGGALFQRSKGQDLLEAIKCFESVLPRISDNESRASCLLNLCSAILARSSRENGHYLETVLRHLNEAQSLSNREEDPVQFAGIQGLLARTYAKIDPILHRIKIIGYYQAALDHI